MKSAIILFIFLVAGCGDNSLSSNKSSDFEDLIEVPTTMQRAAKTIDEQEQGDVQQIEKKRIKRAGLTYQVDQVNDERQLINELLKKSEAYIASESENKSYDRINYSLTIKVPPQYFDQLIDELAANKSVENKWINTDDVTDRYYDLQSRIENKKQLEIRYQTILNQANNVRDILEVERNLNQVRGEIESLQGQFKLLNHQISYSTIDLNFYEVVPYELNQNPRPGLGTRMINSITSGWQMFVTFFVYLLALWPFAILGVLIIFLIRKLSVRRKSKN